MGRGVFVLGFPSTWKLSGRLSAAKGGMTEGVTWRGLED